MTATPDDKAEQPMLSVKLGRWFEARATGWGLAALPIVLLVLVAAAALGVTLRSG